MSAPILDTIKKITYDNLTQFVGDLNHNFAVVQNSPLYKGIPGLEGLEGNPGLRGLRGSKFIFVNLTSFQTLFPNELVSQSDITLNYINTKLLNFTNKQKLLNALGITELVDGDNVVLTNSNILAYNLNLDIFNNTGIAFNAQTNLLSSIESQIQTYVQYYINNNATILGLKNLYNSYSTYAKNYADTSNVYITNQQVESSVYVPYYPGLTTNSNGTLVNHRYFGYTDEEFPRTGNGSIVFGSMKKYIDLLTATVSLTDGVTLTSDYAPGMNNIPAVILMQDTARAGLMIGRKVKGNLRTFAHIYKNSLDELVIQSDSGPDSNVTSLDYSKLIISKTRLRYDKIVDFEGMLNVGGDFTLVGNITSPFINTLAKTVTIGKNLEDSIQRNISNDIYYSKFLSRVLITDGTGKLSKEYSLETMSMVPNEEHGMGLITTIPDSSTKIVTSNYLGFLIRKINGFIAAASTSFYTIPDFTNSHIPDLILSNSLTVRQRAIFGSGTVPHGAIGGGSGGSGSGSGNIVDINNDENYVDLGKNSSSYSNIIGKLRIYDLLGKVLITNQTGEVSSAFSLETSAMDPLEEEALANISNIPTANTKIPTAYYIGFLMRKFNKLSISLGGNGGGNPHGPNSATPAFYSIPNFTDETIPALILSDYLKAAGSVTLGGIELDALFQLDVPNNLVKIGKDRDTISTINGSIILTDYQNNILVTNNQGAVDPSFKLTSPLPIGTVPTEYAIVPNNTSELVNLIPNNIGTRVETDILTGKQNIWIISAINAIKTRFKNTLNKIESDARYLQIANNFSDLVNKAASRTNLDVFSKTESNTLFLVKSNNLSDLADKTATRTNLSIYSKTETEGTIGQKLVFYAKLDGYNGLIVSQKTKLTGYTAYFSKSINGNYTLCFKNLADQVLSLNNKYVLTNSLDGGNDGESGLGLVNIHKCSIVDKISPSFVSNGQITIVASSNTIIVDERYMGEDLNFEVFIFEFAI